MTIKLLVYLAGAIALVTSVSTLATEAPKNKP
jgi:hypothetical protein